MISYAGNGKDSRVTELFIVAPDVSDENLKKLGRNPWEVPFGIVGEVEGAAISKLYSYGELKPDGDGPDPEKINAEGGYDYLKENFEDMDYIKECIVLQDFRDDFKAR